MANLVVDLERRARGPPGVSGPGRQPGEGRAERLEHPGHEPERGADQHAQLLVALVRVSEEPGQRLEQRLVAEGEQLGDRDGRGLGSQRLRRLDVVRLPGERGDDRPGRLEGGVLLAELALLLPPAEEAAAMGGTPVAAGALAPLAYL